MRKYRNLRVWQRADELAVDIYHVTRDFPREELYGITSQLRRAAVSVPTNISEGAGRESNPDYLRFLIIARGSLTETEYLVHLSRRLGYLSDVDWEQLNNAIEQIFRSLAGLINSIRDKKPQTKDH